MILIINSILFLPGHHISYISTPQNRIPFGEVIPVSNVTKRVLLRFNMLKAWMANPNTGDLEIEERYVRWVQELRTDRFVTAMGLPIVYAQNDIPSDVLHDRHLLCWNVSGVPFSA